MPPNSLSLCEIRIFLQLSHRAPIQHIKPEEQFGVFLVFFLAFYFCRGASNQTQKKDVERKIKAINSFSLQPKHEKLNFRTCAVEVLSFKAKLHDESG